MKCKCDNEFEPLYYNGIIKSKLCYQCLIKKGNEKRKKEWNKEKTKLKAELKTESQWLNDLQKLINKIARLIDYGQPCIATGNYKGKMNGGHFASVGSHPSIRFNLHNIHIQSEHSNNWKGGDNVRYSDGLERVYGDEYLDYVRGLRKTGKIGLSTEDIKEKIGIAKKIIKEFSENEIRNAAQRILLREECNARLGIYK